jgi:DNA-binding response OmpR family regulator
LLERLPQNPHDKSMTQNTMAAPTVVLAEDNEDDVFFMRRGWKTAGIDLPLQVLRDGQQVLDYFAGRGDYADRQRFPLPSILLLDLKLPCKSGHEVLQWIRSNGGNQACIVIVLSSSRDASDVARAYSVGANAYLVKPAGAAELVAMLKAFKGFWLESNLAQ